MPLLRTAPAHNSALAPDLRIRKQLVAAGWLEECAKFAHVTYFRLTDLAFSGHDTAERRRQERNVVVQMRPAM